MLTIAFIGILLINPELIALAAFVDAVGLEMFLILIEVQAIAVLGYYFNSHIKPVLHPIYRKLQQLDPYFFIPIYKDAKICPSLLCHVIPGFMLLILGGLTVNQNTDLL